MHTNPSCFRLHKRSKATDFDSAVCLILDINLNDGSGIELRYRLKADGVSVPVIYMSGNDNLDVQKAALASGHRVFEEAILSTGTHRAGQESCHASRERYVLRRHGGRDTLVSVRALAAQRQRWQIG